MDVNWPEMINTWLEQVPAVFTGLLALLAGVLAFLGARRQAIAALDAAQRQSKATLDAIELQLQSEAANRANEVEKRKTALTGHLLLLTCRILGELRLIQAQFRMMAKEGPVGYISPVRMSCQDLLSVPDDYHWSDLSFLSSKAINLFFIIRRQSIRQANGILQTLDYLEKVDSKMPLPEPVARTLVFLADGFEVTIKNALELASILSGDNPELVSFDYFKEEIELPISKFVKTDSIDWDGLNQAFEEFAK